MEVSPRRRVLKTLAALSLTPWLPDAHADEHTLTPSMTEGPFYPRSYPADRDNDLTRVSGRNAQAAGPALDFEGRVLDRLGAPAGGAIVEIWQCDAYGQYHHVGEPESGGDANFQGWGQVSVSEEGRYRFRTIKPPPYPGRTPHIHLTVRRGDKRVLTTQFFFEGEKGNERDFLYRGLGKDAALVTLRLEGSDSALRGSIDVVIAA